MNGLRLITALLTAVAVFALTWVLLDPSYGRTFMQRRITALRLFRAGPAHQHEPRLKQWRAAAGLLVDRIDVLHQLALRSEPLLDRAATDMRPSEWLAIRLGISFVLGFVLAVVFGGSFWALGFLIGALAGFFGTNALLSSRVTRRQTVFADELPGTLQLVLSSLRSGFTLQQSIEAAVRDDTGPVAEELSRALSESRINGEFEDALARAGERIRSQEMSWLVMAIRLQREVGGSLADVMQTTADTMRERAYLRRHVRSLSAEGRFSAYILVAMPIGIGLLLYFTRPEYVSLLFQQPLGLLMIGAAIALMLIGGVWLKATVKIEV